MPLWLKTLKTKQKNEKKIIKNLITKQFYFSFNRIPKLMITIAVVGLHATETIKVDWLKLFENNQ